MNPATILDTAIRENRRSVSFDEELVLASSAKYSYLYAFRILRRPFPLGESMIATSPEYSCRYAIFILKGPFPAGEYAIYSSDIETFLYEREISNGPS